MSRMKTVYQQEVVNQLKKELGVANLHQLPALDKVVINVGVGRALQDNRLLGAVENTLRKISGQQPVKTVAKQSIAGFKLREGVDIGLKVTLRRERMYEFLDRLVSIVLPRTRDFRGLVRSAFDPQGNYSIGLRDQSVFPELTYEDTTLIHGIQITLVTKGNDAKANQRLLELLGFPFERKMTTEKKA